jgi:hypothetical protein
MAREDLEKNGMMRGLLESLDAGQDVGHYGRLVFTMVARHFLDEEELVGLLANDPGCGEEAARSLVHQVKSRGYSPPRREKVLDFQARQDFAFCDPADPDACNVYKDLEFPEDVYQHISEYHEQKQVAEEEGAAAQQ